MERRTFLAGTGVVFPAAPRAAAQQRGRTWRVGFLAGRAPPPDGAPPLALRQALQGLGYVEQQHAVHLGRWADAKHDRLPGLAVELVGLKVDVIVTVGGPASEAAKQATSSIPIVLANLPVFGEFFGDLHAKKIEVFTMLLPRPKRLLILTEHADPMSQRDVEEARRAARALRVELIEREVTGERSRTTITSRPRRRSA